MPLVNPSRSVQDHNAVFSAHFAEFVAAEDCDNPLLKALHKTFFREFWLAGVYRLVSDLLTVGSRYSIRYLITYIAKAYVSHIAGSTYPEPALSLGVGLSVGLIVMNILMSWTQQHFLYTGQAVGGQVRAVLTAKIQEKSMKISERAKAGITVTALGAGSSSSSLATEDIADANHALRQLEGEGYRADALSIKSSIITDAEGYRRTTRFSRYSRHPRQSQYIRDSQYYPQSPHSPKSPRFGRPDSEIPPVPPLPPIPKPAARQSRLERISRYSYFQTFNSQVPDIVTPTSPTVPPLAIPRPPRAQPRERNSVWPAGDASRNTLYPRVSEYQRESQYPPRTPRTPQSPRYPRGTLFPRDSQYTTYTNSLYPRNSMYARNSTVPPQLSRFTWYARYSQWMRQHDAGNVANQHLAVNQNQTAAARKSRYTHFSQFPDVDIDAHSSAQYTDSEYEGPVIEYENEQGELVETHGQGWNNSRIMNLINIDTIRLDACISMVHMAWTSPIIIVICMALILSNLTFSGLSGLATIILGFITLTIAVKKLWIARAGINVVTDARVSLTQELISAIRMIKFFGWEPSFLDRLSRLADEQTKELLPFSYIFNYTMALGQALPTLAAMLAFITYGTGSGHQLDIAIVFSSISLFSSLLLPSTYLPAVLGQVSESSQGLGRIQEFLLAEEKEDVEIDRDMKNAVVLDDAEFCWDKSHAAPPTEEEKKKKEEEEAAKNAKKDEDKSDNSSDITLAENEEDHEAAFHLPSMSLDIRRGELIAVIGGIGSGKSSLLSALTGDMRKTSGKLKLSSELAYCPQSAWIQSSTVRENILFGCPFDPEWYDIVVDACQLRRDFGIFPNGDATEIGEKGTNMSGGQKQRLSLARAVYSRADIVLLDDVLSAVDPHVGLAIFDQAILGLLRHKTVILATHTAHVLNRCDRILWLDHGMIKSVGTFDEVSYDYPELNDMVKEGQQSDEKKKDESEAEKDAKKIMAEGFRQSDEVAPNELSLQDSHDSTEDNTPPHVPKDAKTDGKGTFTVFKAYLSCSGSWIPIILALPILCIAQAGSLLCGIWVGAWAQDTYHLSRNTYIGIYVMIGVTMFIAMYVYGVFVCWACLTANRNLLKKANANIVNAPTWFFDITPLGQITSRFAKDMGTLDDGWPEALRLFFYSISLILAICILIIYHFPYFAFAVGPCVFIFIIAVIYYQGSSGQLKVFDGNSRASVAARVTETLTGIPTIRTYSQQGNFAKKLQSNLDDMLSANILSFASQRWLAFRLDFLGIMLIVAAVILVMVERNTNNPGTSAVVLTYSLTATQSLQYIVRQYANVEVAMGALERMYSYACDDTFPVEGKNNKTIQPATSSWPENGAINFSNVRMRYRPGLPEVLRGLTLNVRAGEHIGIVGRTGAGKSSLISALFRVCELSRGCVSIDGVDISTLSLADLRTRISIQPQESVLFAGTVRANLDPLGNHTDEELWLALRGAWLADILHLDDNVEEDGANFSHGARQQLGLARLLVKNSKIVICDEATSNVDLETDQKIQQTISHAFRGKTMLTVAHRIRTIIGYDRICVMDQGRIKELGTPMQLYQQGGVFREMCDTSGISEKEIMSYNVL